MPDHAPTTPQSLNDALVETYLRYVDTAYWLRDKRLMVERRQRLLESGMLATEPFLEPVLTYPATEAASAVADAMGIDREVAELVGRVLFGAFTEPGQPIRLRAHQAEAVRATFKPGTMDKRNIVVTSGTGSGKTERTSCFRSSCALSTRLGRGTRSRNQPSGGRATRGHRRPVCGAGSDGPLPSGR